MRKFEETLVLVVYGTININRADYEEDDDFAIVRNIEELENEMGKHDIIFIEANAENLKALTDHCIYHIIYLRGQKELLLNPEVTKIALDKNNTYSFGQMAVTQRVYFVHLNNMMQKFKGAVKERV